MPTIPSLVGKVPQTPAFLPGMERRLADLPEAEPSRAVDLTDGDTLALVAGLVRRRIHGRDFALYGYNRQYPGPLLKVPEDATIVVRFRNEIEQPTTVHWHGVRLENRFDGVPGVTQEAVHPGGDFTYRVHFRDSGIYWYHPHIRTAMQIDAGLYGNILVRPSEREEYAPVNQEEVLVLDDLLFDEEGLLPWGGDEGLPSHALMGRFGNLLLVNGRPDYELEVGRDAVVRFHLTNVANTRTFHVRFGNAQTKIVATDVSRYEREQWIEGVVIGVAQRYSVEVAFPEPGRYPITNEIQAIDHFRATFYRKVDTLGFVRVTDERVEGDHTDRFERLGESGRLQAELEDYRPHFDRPVDHRLEMTVEVEGLPLPLMQMMAVDTLYFPPVEFNDAMPMMNWLSTGREVRWILRDPDTGLENMDIGWKFEEGELAKIRIHNSADSFHPMHHPVHLHGQRFLVLAKDGSRNRNLAWKDTVILPVGSTYDLLVDFSNPGDWLLHCHIAEHVESGMKTLLRVHPRESEAAEAPSRRAGSRPLETGVEPGSPSRLDGEKG